VTIAIEQRKRERVDKQLQKRKEREEKQSVKEQSAKRQSGRPPGKK
jgi:hypothetical protein